MFYSQISDQSLDVGVVVGGCLESAQAVAEVSHHYGLPIVSKLCTGMEAILDARTHAHTHTFPSTYTIQVSYSPLMSDNIHQTFPYLTSVVPAADLVSVGVAAILRHYDWKMAVAITQNLPEFTAVSLINLIGSLISAPFSISPSFM